MEFLLHCSGRKLANPYVEIRLALAKARVDWQLIGTQGRQGK